MARDRSHDRRSALLAALMAAQAAIGLLWSDAYRDVGWIRATWYGNDAITLLVAVPLLVLARRRARRGSVRGMLLWYGLLGYAVYNYAFYLLGAALNVFFLLYAGLVVLAAFTLLLALRDADPPAVAASAGRVPVRLLGGYFVFVAVGLTAVWTVMWALHVFAGRPAPGSAEAFRLVAALDLTLMVPVLVAGGVLLWRRRPWGWIVAAIAGVQGALYLVVLAVNSAVAVARGLEAAPGQLPIWVPLATCTAAAVVVLLRRVADARG